MTGLKSPRHTQWGNINRITLPWNGKQRVLLVRCSNGVPTPEAIEWADAFALTFNMWSQRSLSGSIKLSFSHKACVEIAAAITKYHRLADIPMSLVAVQRHSITVAHTSDISHQDTVTAAECSAMASRLGLQLLTVNPETGVNIPRLFHDLVHDIVEYVQQDSSAGARVGKLSVPVSRSGAPPPAEAEDLGQGRSIPLRQVP
jgi:hypothetical protein